MNLMRMDVYWHYVQPFKGVTLKEKQKKKPKRTY